MATTITSREKAIYEADFARFDKDANGGLMGGEAVEMAKFQLGASTSEAEIDNLIDGMDVNKDGRIEVAEYMNKILGQGWTVLKADDSELQVGKSYCSMKNMMEKAAEIYINGSIPLVCGTTEDFATQLTTFLKYKGGAYVACKPLVGMAMGMGDTAAWETITNSAASAVQNESTMVLDMGNGCPDLCGYAKKGDPANGEMTLKSLFDTRERDSKKFPGLNGCDFVHPGFKLMVCSEFLEEDVLDFMSWGPIPLRQCHLLVVNEA